MVQGGPCRRGAGGGSVRRQHRGERGEGHGGVRLRQPHRPHAHGQRPGRRAGGHPGQRAQAGRLRHLEGVLRQRRGQPDPQVCRVHRRPVPPDPVRGGERPLPGGGLPRGRHQGAGPGHLPGARGQLEGPVRGGAAGQDGPVRPVHQHPQNEGGPAQVRHRVRPVVLRVLPPRERLCGRDGGTAGAEGLDL